MTVGRTSPDRPLQALLLGHQMHGPIHARKDAGLTVITHREVPRALPRPGVGPCTCCALSSAQYLVPDWWAMIQDQSELSVVWVGFAR